MFGSFLLTDHIIHGFCPNHIQYICQSNTEIQSLMIITQTVLIIIIKFNIQLVFILVIGALYLQAI